ncbi:hypothetical protein BJ878DRAFT_212447 [Calycina marina]|uniref:Uncharacterized protein n=1 Tax=Calycina marina TaxID=1763456 RepID=A0A9P7YYT1_9HELO|nr:hypothetical protein BJ878DRAFT_212447 [Calycina marina]
MRISTSSIWLVAAVLGVHAQDHIHANRHAARNYEETLAGIKAALAEGLGYIPQQTAVIESKGVGPTSTIIQGKATPSLTAAPGNSTAATKPGIMSPGVAGNTTAAQATGIAPPNPPAAGDMTAASVPGVASPSSPGAALNGTTAPIAAHPIPAGVSAATVAPFAISPRSVQPSVMAASAPTAPNPTVAHGVSIVKPSGSVANVQGVGAPGEVVAGWGTIAADGHCACNCLCSSGSFATASIVAAPAIASPASVASVQSAAVPAVSSQAVASMHTTFSTTFATLIMPSASSVSVPPGVLVDTSSTPVVVSTAIAPTSVAVPSIQTSSASITTAVLSSTTSVISSTTAVLSSTTSIISSTTAVISSATSTLVPVAQSAVGQSSTLPMSLAATQYFTLALNADPTLQTQAQATAAVSQLLINPINIATFQLSSTLVLGNLANPTPV